jgi:hypothetical protein
MSIENFFVTRIFRIGRIQCVLGAFCLFQTGIAKAESTDPEQCCRSVPTLADHANNSHEIIAEIDRIFPRRKPEESFPARTLGDIKGPNVVTFDNGESIEIDGILCDQDGIDNLKRIAGVPGIELLIEYAEPTGRSRPLAHVWARETLIVESEPERWYSSPTETALTSGWCVPTPMQDKELAQRYLLLHTAFKERRAQVEADR